MHIHVLCSLNKTKNLHVEKKIVCWPCNGPPKKRSVKGGPWNNPMFKQPVDLSMTEALLFQWSLWKLLSMIFLSHHFREWTGSGCVSGPRFTGKFPPFSVVDSVFYATINTPLKPVRGRSKKRNAFFNPLCHNLPHDPSKKCYCSLYLSLDKHDKPNVQWYFAFPSSSSLQWTIKSIRFHKYSRTLIKAAGNLTVRYGK